MNIGNTTLAICSTWPPSRRTFGERPLCVEDHTIPRGVASEQERQDVVAKVLRGPLADELTAIKAALADDLSDPARLFVPQLFFQVWGRKPA